MPMRQNDTLETSHEINDQKKQIIYNKIDLKNRCRKIILTSIAHGGAQLKFVI